MGKNVNFARNTNIQAVIAKAIPFYSFSQVYSFTSERCFYKRENGG